MRQTNHLCLSSHDEVMYRDEEDLIMGFNSLALAIYATESRLLAEAFMPTHNHQVVQTDDWKDLVKRERYTYTRYFNAKYHRRGRLGEKNYFQLTVEGIHHTQTLLNYVIRQGLHHGLVSTPFEYDHCSANCFFRKELGKEYNQDAFMKNGTYASLPEHRRLPHPYRMLESGLIVREDVIDTAYVEEIYITARNFIYQMNRITVNNNEEDELKGKESVTFSLDDIEHGVQDFDMKKALINEQGKVNKSVITDIELCGIIDNIILPRYFNESDKKSIYLLPVNKRKDIGNIIWQESKDAFAHNSSSFFRNKKTTPAQIKTLSSFVELLRRRKTEWFSVFAGREAAEQRMNRARRRKTE